MPSFAAAILLRPPRSLALSLAAASVALCLLAGCGTVRTADGPVDGPADDPVAHLLAPPAWPDEATRDAPPLDPIRLERAVHALVNEARLERGLAPLRWQEPLARVARAHSLDMAALDFFGHTNPDGQDASDRARVAGLTGTAQAGGWVSAGVGENLFATHRFVEYTMRRDADGRAHWSFVWKTEEQIAREAVAGWLASRTHRHNLFSTLYTAGAIGVALDDNEAVFVTHNLVTPALAGR